MELKPPVIIAISAALLKDLLYITNIAARSLYIAGVVIIIGFVYFSIAFPIYLWYIFNM